MINCGHCKARLLDGALFCDSCGFNLWAQTKTEAMTSKLNTETDGLKIRSGWGTATLRTQRELIIYVNRDDAPIRVIPRDGFLFGRKDVATGTFPDLDLIPYGAEQHGVSRKHAMLRQSETDPELVMIADLGSANGTFLNGVRLGTNQPRLLRDGDEIRMANLKLHFYFA